MSNEVTTKRVAHVHAELIIAWANGAQIQYRYRDALMGDPAVWCDVGSSCSWDKDTTYRIKPERVYPKSTLTSEAMYDLLWPDNGNKPVRPNLTYYAMRCQRVADAAVKQYIIDRNDETL